MMQIIKPAKLLNQVRYLAFIPVILALTFLFACQEKPTESEEIVFTETSEKLSVEEPEVLIIVEEPPEFPGGIEAMHQFLRENIVFPAEAREQRIQGTVFVTFVVERDGRISNVRVLRGIGGGADEEAMRVISMMPDWTPGKQDGEPVRVQFNMPIRFTLSGETQE